MLQTETDKSHAPTPGAPAIPKRLKFNWASEFKPGVFMLIDKRKLLIDEESYQREQVSKGKILEIAKNFDWRLFGVLSVVRRNDGKFYVFDGGHRRRAADYRDDISELPCMVFDTKSIEEEAKGFIGANKMKSNVSAYHTFKASVVAKEPIALKAESLCAKLGLTISNGRHKNSFRAINTLIAMLERDSALAEKVMVLCFHISRGSNGISSNVMRGIEYLAKRPEIGDDIFFRPLGQKLVDAGMEEIEHEINRAKGLYGKGGDLVVARGVLNVINKKRRKKIVLGAE